MGIKANSGTRWLSFREKEEEEEEEEEEEQEGKKTRTRHDPYLSACKRIRSNIEATDSL